MSCTQPQPLKEPCSPVGRSCTTSSDCIDGGEAFEVELEHGWVPLDTMTTSMIKQAGLRGQNCVEYSARGQDYVIDLNAMHQVNKRTGMIRRVRHAEHNEILECNDEEHVFHAGASLGEPPQALEVPKSFPELSRLGEAELGRLKANPSALDEWILNLPQARASIDRLKMIQKENSELSCNIHARKAELQRSHAMMFAVRAQQAEVLPERCLAQALEAPEMMDAAALANFREQYIQYTLEKQRKVVLKEWLDPGVLD